MLYNTKIHILCLHTKWDIPRRNKIIWSTFLGVFGYEKDFKYYVLKHIFTYLRTVQQ